jgi:hypothetical protein
MPAQAEIAVSDPAEDVFLSGAETRAWLEISHDELDGLIKRGLLEPTPSRVNLKPVFDARAVSRLAAKRSRLVPRG